MKQTENCVFCGKRAKLWSGYVIKNGRSVIAGWCCEEHAYKLPGFRGHWKKWMGKCK